MNAQSAAIAISEDGEVSAGLRRFDHAESISLTRDGNVGWVVTRDL
jgi:hypothetical protein